MFKIGILIEGLDGTSALDIKDDLGNPDRYDVILNTMIDYLYNLPSHRKIFKMLEPAENAVMSILTNFGEVIDVYVVDVQYIEDEDEDDDDD